MENLTINQLVEKFEKYNLELLITTEKRFIARAVKIKSREKFLKKYVLYLSFSSLEKLTEYLTGYIQNIEVQENKKNELKELKRRASSEFNHQYKVGQILYTSWGYEQTNLTYFQIVGFKGKNAILRRIAKKCVQETSWASGMFEPMENQFTSGELIKRISPSVNYYGVINYHINMGESEGYLMEYKNTPNHCSWYA